MSHDTSSKASIDFLLAPKSPEISEPIAYSSVVSQAAISSNLAEIQYILDGGNLENKPHFMSGAAKWERNISSAHKGYAKWNLLSTVLEPRYTEFARMSIPSYVLPWDLEVCKHKSRNGKASRVLFIQLMIAEMRGLAVINRFETPAKGFWGVDKVFVPVDSINAFSSMPVSIPLAGMNMKERKTINCLWNRAGFDIATRCSIDGVPHVFFAYDDKVLEKTREAYTRSKRDRDERSGLSGAAEAATAAEDI